MRKLLEIHTYCENLQPPQCGPVNAVQINNNESVHNVTLCLIEPWFGFLEPRLILVIDCADYFHQVGFDLERLIPLL